MGSVYRAHVQKTALRKAYSMEEQLFQGIALRCVPHKNVQST